MNLRSRRPSAGTALSPKAAVLVLLAVGMLGTALAANKSAQLLGSQASAEAQQARRSLLKQRTQSLSTSTHAPGKTLGASHRPGRTIVGRAKTSS